MIIAALTVLGLALGSFVNALVWRLHEQSREQRAKSKGAKTKESLAPGSQPSSLNLSILKGRSMCTHCRHVLTTRDLIPIFSWLSLHGKCRHCGKSIGWQYPLVELTVAALLVVSYLFWPIQFDADGVVAFIVWLAAITAFVALIVYDLRWMLLPDRIVMPLIGLAVINVILQAIIQQDFGLIRSAVLSLAIAGGIFYVLFQVSNGKWIGGGDVKLGFAIGLLLMNPALAFLMLFVASLLGTLVALPGLMSGKLGRTSRLPFGPFLMSATIIVQLWGQNLIDWYSNLLGL